MTIFIGLRAKFIILSFLCITATAVLITYKVLAHERVLLEKNIRQQGLTLVKSSAILFTNAFIYEELGMIDSAVMADYLEYYVSDISRTDPHIISFLVLDKEGRVVAHNNLREYGKPYKSAAITRMLDSKAPFLVRRLEQDSGTTLEISMPLAIASKSWGVCQIVFSLNDIDDLMADLRQEVIRITLITLLVSLAIIGLTVNYCVKPLRRLSNVMDQITHRGDLFLPLPKLSNRRDETGQLLRAFQWMIQRLKQEEKERIRTMKMMFQTEKMATIGQLTASLAHEINNPLGGVILCFNNLIKNELDEENKKQHIDTIHESLQHIQRIMRDLLDYSRQSSLNIQPSEVKDVVKKSVALIEALTKQKHIAMHVSVPPNLPLIPLDAMKIQQVLINLLVNAIHAMLNGGTLSVNVRVEDDYCILTVRDTGYGVPEAIQAKIFNPFFTTKEAGKATGLGLTLSRSIVEQHGGKLYIVHTGAEGSTFAICLPVQEARYD